MTSGKLSLSLLMTIFVNPHPPTLLKVAILQETISQVMMNDVPLVD